VRDGDVIKNNVEILRAADETVADESGYLRTVGEELISVELRDDGLENLVADGRQNLLIVLEAEVLDNDGELADFRTGEDAECEVDHLKIFGAGDGGEGVRARADVENVGFLNPRDEKMGSLADGVVENAPEPVEEDSALAAVDGVQGGGEGGGRRAQAEGRAGEVSEERDCGLAATHYREEGFRVFGGFSSFLD